MDCPFTHRACTDCAVYRGRHHYIASFKQGDSRNSGQEDQVAAYFKAVEKQLNPWTDNNGETTNKLRIKLELVNAESGKTRLCELEEARAWDWGDPRIMRIIGDRQVMSYKNLIEIMLYMQEKGLQAIKLYEFPRFMFLAGG